MESIIQINNLKKSFNGVAAINDISLNIKQGEMFGLVGPDGAGKTTLIRILCGLLLPDGGTIQMLGMDLFKARKKIQNNIGYLSQKFSLYGDLTIDENIEFFADIHNISDFENKRDELLAFTRLKLFRNRLAEQLSGGMKQKLALACSLIHEPQIIFLDEPTRGVDPVSRRDFWKILADLLKKGVTIFMSTSYLDEAERCNRVAMVNKGEVIALDNPPGIKKIMEKEVVEVVCDPIKTAYHAIKQYTSFESQIFGDRINIIVNNFKQDYPDIENLFHKNNIRIYEKRTITPSLENVFMYLIK